VYAGIRVEVRPLARGKGTVFAWNAGANIPARFATAVAQGVRDAISKGVLAGLELADVLVSVEDGSYQAEDSSEAAFREVTQRATTAALRQAHPTAARFRSTSRLTKIIRVSLSTSRVMRDSVKQSESTSKHSLTARTDCYSRPGTAHRTCTTILNNAGLRLVSKRWESMKEEWAFTLSAVSGRLG
jgi:hypothetical protein